MPPRWANAERPGAGYYGPGSFFVTTDDRLLLSPAYISLTDSAKLILRDFIRAVDVATSYGFRPPPAAGIPYSYAHCREPIGRSAFYMGITALCERGFITPTSATQSSRTAYFSPSSRWSTYKPSPAEKKKFAAWRTRFQPNATTRERQLYLELRPTAPNLTEFPQPDERPKTMPASVIDNMQDPRIREACRSMAASAGYELTPDPEPPSAEIQHKQC